MLKTVVAFHSSPPRPALSFTVIHDALKKLLTQRPRILCLYQPSHKMATPDIYVQPGASDSPYSKIASPPRVLPSPRETQASLKRSFEKYLAADNGSTAVGKLFRPIDHLAYEEPKHIHTMEEIGFSANSGVSPVAVSDPFPLFSEEAIDIMRKEVLDPEVLEKYSYTSDIAPRQIRGYAPK